MQKVKLLITFDNSCFSNHSVYDEECNYSFLETVTEVNEFNQCNSQTWTITLNTPNALAYRIDLFVGDADCDNLVALWPEEEKEITLTVIGDILSITRANGNNIIFTLQEEDYFNTLCL